MRPEAALAIGPFNWGGQARAWSECLQAATGVRAFSFAGTAPSTMKVTGRPHRRTPHHRLRPYAVRNYWLRATLKSATHVLSEALSPLIMGGGHGVMTDEELAWWSRRGTVLGGVFHGSDIRQPSRHIERISGSYFLGFPAEEREATERETIARRVRADQSGIPLFVSTPDLLIDVPQATWLPLVVDLAAWECDVPALQRRVPRVLHVPSKRVPPVKGTSVIDPVLQGLHKQGAIEYISPASVPHDEMPDLVRSVDVVVDQIMTGSYGVAAVESMAAGRLTVGYLAPDVRSAVAEEIPIVDAAPDDFVRVMDGILDNIDTAAAIAAAGPQYAREVHDGSRSAAVLAGFVGVG